MIIATYTEFKESPLSPIKTEVDGGLCTKSRFSVDMLGQAASLNPPRSSCPRLYVQSFSDIREAQQRGYITKTPHFNAISNYLELESMTPYLKRLIGESSLPLKAIESDFAADSSGFATGQFSRWFDAKYGATMKQHDWLKVRLMCGVKTNIVTSVEVSGARANDSPYLKPLLETTSRNGFQVKELSADKGYDSFNNCCLVLVKGGIPYIPFREGEQRQPSSGNA